jgi:signal transduction histidine kinase
MLTEPPLTDNAALNEILQLVQEIASALGQGYSDVIGNNNVNVTTTPVTVDANEFVVKRVITNLGSNLVQITEDGGIVAVIDYCQTWESAFTGAGQITLKCLGTSSTVAVASYVSAPTTINIH